MNAKFFVFSILGTIILTWCWSQSDKIKDLNELTGSTWMQAPTTWNVQTWDSQTGNKLTGDNQKINEFTGTSETKDINDIAKEKLLDYYSKLNQGMYEDALSYFSTGLRNYPSIKKEFSVEKLTKFYKAVDNDLTINNITQTDKSNTKTFTYSVYYEINGTLYNEIRRLSFRYNENNQSKPWEIIQIMCDKNCEKYPFFNMKKFWLE